MMGAPRRMVLTDAAKRLGISPTTLRRLVTDGQLQTYANPLDKRQRLVDVEAVEALARLQPQRAGDAGKTIATA
jgi:predicted site-specific integrase-resolvase